MLNGNFILLDSAAEYFGQNQQDDLLKLKATGPRSGAEVILHQPSSTGVSSFARMFFAAAIIVHQLFFITAATEALEPRRLLTTFYVDTNNPASSDSNPGTSITAPLKTINQALVLSQNNNATSQSDQILIRGGVYHEQPYVGLGNSGASATDRTVISAYVNPTTGTYEPVYVDAADPTTGTWTRDGTSNRWYLSNFTTQTSGVWMDWSATNDGAGLQQIGGYAGESSATRKIVGNGVADMYAGTYYGDAADSRLYVWLADGSDPNTHTIEYANRARSFYQPGTSDNNGGYLYANYVDFKGLKLRHDNVYNTDGQDTGCAIYTNSDEHLIDCDIQWNAGEGVYLRGNSQMTNCICSNNGGNGVAAQGNGFLINGGHYNSNFWRQYNTGSAAGIKVITDVPTIYGDIENIEAASNFGHGIWYDTCFENSVISHITGNYVHDNQQDGIDLEASRNFVVANNVIVSNQADGISVNATENAQIYNNTIVGNYGIAAIDLDGGTRDQGSTYPGTTGTINVSIRNNIIANNFTVYDLDVPTSAVGTYINNNTADYNLFYRRGGPLHYTTGGTYVGWGSTPTSLSNWRTASGQDAHSLVADPLFVTGGIGALAYMLGSNSPAKDAGVSITTVVTTDYSGTMRPQFAGYDIGAFEYASGGVGTAGPVVTNTDSTVWVDDQLPTNAAMTAPDQTGNIGQNRFWQWNSTTTYSGAASLDSTIASGTHRQYFTGAGSRTIGAGDVLFAYVWIDPVNLPSQIMLEWRDSTGSWNHMAYWGQNLIAGGVDGSTGFHYIGHLPVAGHWARLEVPAATVGLAGVKVTGFSFDLYNGRALLDKIGNGPAAARLHGNIYQDNNGNGIFNTGEPALANATVFIDLNNDGTDDTIDPTATTDSSGTYFFSGLTAGIYLVRQIVPTGFVASTSGGSSYSISLTTGGNIDQDFGLFPTSFSSTQNGDSFIVAQSADTTRIQVWQNAIESTSPTYSVAVTQLPQIQFQFGAYNDSLTMDLANGVPAVIFSGSGNDALNITGGNYTFTADPQSTTPNLTVNIATGASVSFAAGAAGSGITDFHLAGLNVSSGATAVLGTSLDVTDRSLLIVSLLTSAGKIDLTNNDMIVRNGNMGTIAGLLSSGFDNGYWDGPTGIVSLAAHSDIHFLTAVGSSTGITGSFDGQTISAGDVTLKYTYYGDANLDGVVDGSDYSRLDSAALTQATGWNNGDFNYDGVINGSDYTLIDNSFNQQAVSLASQVTVKPVHHMNATTAAILASASYIVTRDTQSFMNTANLPTSAYWLENQKKHARHFYLQLQLSDSV